MGGVLCSASGGLSGVWRGPCAASRSAWEGPAVSVAGSHRVLQVLFQGLSCARPCLSCLHH